jgi:uncharacterized protein YkwD
LASFRKASLDKHNEFRAKHVSTDPLSPNSDVDEVAQAFANKMAQSGVFEHSNVQDLGENLAMGGSGDLSSPDKCAGNLFSTKNLKKKDIF